MGLIRSLIGALFLRGGADRLIASGARAARVLRPDDTRALELGHDAYAAAHASHLAEFAHARPGRFDAFVNGLNRLPRPLLALGTLGLFVYAMADPAGFAQRMRALSAVPEPMWWLLGAVVAFYFGAREAHHLREHRPLRLAGPAMRLETPAVGPGAARADPPPADPPAPVHPPGPEAPDTASPGPRPALPRLRPAPAPGPSGNAALEAWRAARGPLPPDSLGPDR